MKREVLFLIADTGGGHRASATVVAAELERQHPGEFSVTIVDPFVEAAPSIGKFITSLYGPMARHVRWLWGAVYQATNSRFMVRVLCGSALKLLKPGLAKLIDDQRPEVIVSFHPLLNHMSLAVIDALPGERRPKLLTVVTDYISIHPFWFVPAVDGIVVPTEMARAECLKRGFEETRIHAFGLPVGTAFSDAALSDTDTGALRASLNVEGTNPLIVVCGGGDGAGRLKGLTRRLASSAVPYDAAIICGNNRRLERKLSAIAIPSDRQVRILGFVRNMADWLRAADVVITKAGPGTVMEALCCKRPFLLCWYLPGQEKGTVTWLVQKHITSYATAPSVLLRRIADVLALGDERRQKLLSDIAKLATPRATEKTAALIASFMSPQ